MKKKLKKISDGPVDVAIAAAAAQGQWKKDVQGRLIVGGFDLPETPADRRDPIFPPTAVLVNEAAGQGFQMRMCMNLDVAAEGRDLHVETITKVCEAHLLKGPRIKFLDGKPPGPTVLTMSVDGEKVLDRVPVEKFMDPDPKLDFSKPWCKGVSCLFTAAEDTKEKKRIGLFLPNESSIWMHVDTERRVEIRLVMAEYTTRMGP